MNNKSEILEQYLRKTTQKLLATENKLVEAEDKLRELKKKEENNSAIIGMSCLLPGGISTLSQFWQALKEGKDLTSDFPNRWNELDLYSTDSNEPGRTPVHRGGFVDSIEFFDAKFFDIAPREAENMDPQQRILLQKVWHAIEDASLSLDELRSKKTAVFVGNMGSDYNMHKRANQSSYDGHQGTGNSASILSSRLAYWLGLKGAAISVDTACSSSLVSLHLAHSSIIKHECDIAIVAGITLMSSPNSFIEFSRLGGLSHDGRCKSFSAQADGTAWAEGCGVLILKRASAARAAGQQIHALIPGSAIGQDGKSKGLTAPNGLAQESVIREALKVAGLNSEDIDAIEAHGTGTPLGDPIEASALARVFCKDGKRGAKLWLGSVKSNFGHAQAAAGIIGVIKMALAMQHRYLPQTLHCQQPTSKIAWNQTQLALLQEGRNWDKPDSPRRAGISSFGFGGTNSHLIIEEERHLKKKGSFEDANDPIWDHFEPPIILKAQSEMGLNNQIANWQTHCKNLDADQLKALARASSANLNQFSHKMAISDYQSGSLLDTLADLLKGSTAKNSFQGEALKGGVCIVFSGQGSQYLGMAKELYRDSECFREVVQKINSELSPYTKINFIDFIEGGKDQLNGLIHQTQFTQPLLFMVEVGLFRLWEKLGLKIHAMIGHSVGEIAAAYLAGSLDLTAACQLVVARANLMHQCPQKGKMASIFATKEEVESYLSGSDHSICIAAYNSPTQIVISGASEGIDEAVNSFKAQNKRATILQTSHAFHSSHMQQAIPIFEKILTKFNFSTPTVPIISTLTGKPVAQFDAEYWCDEIISPVQFQQAIEYANEKLGCQIFIECGPGRNLTNLIKKTLASKKFLATESIDRVQGDFKTLQNSINKILTLSHHLQIKAPTVHFPLPTYQFAKIRHWNDDYGVNSQSYQRSKTSPHPHVLRKDPNLSFKSIHVFTGEISLQRFDWLFEHQLNEQPIAPGSALLVWIAEAIAGSLNKNIEHLEWKKPFLLEPTDEYVLQLAVHKNGSANFSFTLQTLSSSGKLTKHVEGSLSNATEFSCQPTWKNTEEVSEVSLTQLREKLALTGLSYGALFNCIRSIEKQTLISQSEAETTALKVCLESESMESIRPIAAIDSAIQAVGGLFMDEIEDGESYLPASIGSTQIHSNWPAKTTAYITKKPSLSADSLRVDIEIAGTSGESICSISDLSLKKATLTQVPSGSQNLYSVEFHPLNLSAFHDNESISETFLPATVIEVKNYVGETKTALMDLLAQINMWLQNPNKTTSPLIIQGYCAEKLSGSKQNICPISSAAMALTLSFAQEQKDRTIKYVDCKEISDQIIKNSLSAKNESALFIREDGIFVRRIAPRSLEGFASFDPQAKQENWKVCLQNLGSQNILKWQKEARRESLAPHEVEIEVKASGLNFRDALKKLGLVESPDFGLECAGRVSRVGKDAKTLKPGDWVMGMSLGSCAQYAVSHEDYFCPLPDGMQAVEAATLPLVAITALHALQNVAQIKEGERILIHSAASGVGLAALELALHKKAIIYCTASPQKWGFLEQKGIPSSHIASSRKTDFVKKFQSTGLGQGIDIVLNSLGKEMIKGSAELLTKKGRFVEIGKANQQDSENILKSYPEVQYAHFDLMTKPSAFIQKLLQDLQYYLEQKIINPLPLHCFPLNQVEEAIQFMTKGHHIGKIVLTPPGHLKLNPNHSNFALLTGAFGGVGAALAEHLATKGQKNFILVSRSGNRTAGAVDLKERLQNLGCHEVYIEACDLSDPIACKNMLTKFAQKPITSVYHLAGATADATLNHLDEESFAKVLNPKTVSLRNLLSQMRKNDLDLITLVSSLSGISGAVGQANYAAANAELYAYGELLKSEGWPIATVALGLCDTHNKGMVAKLNSKQKNQLAKMGFELLPAKQMLAGIDSSIAINFASPNPLHSLLCAALNPKAFAKSTHQMDSFWDLLMDSDRGKKNTTELDWKALEPEDAKKKILKEVKRTVQKILNLPSLPKDDEVFAELGCDSLMAVEIVQSLTSDLNCDLPTSLVYDYPTATAVGDYIFELIFTKQNAEEDNFLLEESDIDAQLDKMLDEIEERVTC